jgi:hypothetical protein
MDRLAGMYIAISGSMDIIMLTCPTCGVVLHADSASTHIACWYCGSSYNLHESNLDATLNQIAAAQVEQELSEVIHAKETKVNELGRCIQALLHLPAFSTEPLMSKRNHLEDEILELSHVINLKETELGKLHRMSISSDFGI